jgi:hypothetical protein
MVKSRNVRRELRISIFQINIELYNYEKKNVTLSEMSPNFDEFKSEGLHEKQA